MSVHKLGINCVKCNNDEWTAVDNPNEYIEMCNSCGKMIVYRKQDFVNKFTCKECGCLSGKLEENDLAIAVRCTNCGKAERVLEKHDPLNNRNKPPRVPGQIRCPRCGGTQITTSARGVNGFWGFIGASKTVNRCANCGKTWEPKR